MRLTNKEYYEKKGIKLSTNIKSYNSGYVKSIKSSSVDDYYDVYHKDYEESAKISITKAVADYTYWLAQPNEILTLEEYNLLELMVRSIKRDDPDIKSITVMKYNDRVSVDIELLTNPRELMTFRLSHSTPDLSLLGDNYQFKGLDEYHEYSIEELGLC